MNLAALVRRIAEEIIRKFDEADLDDFDLDDDEVEDALSEDK